MQVGAVLFDVSDHIVIEATMTFADELMCYVSLDECILGFCRNFMENTGWD